MTYSVRTYSADGHGHMNDRILATGCTLKEARLVCRSYLGLKRLTSARRWTPGVGVHQDGSTSYSPEAYHDYPPSARWAEGCGGVAICEE